MIIPNKGFTSNSPAQTLRFAKSFAKGLRRGAVVGLIGPLGSGKTLFAKGLCEGLGVDPEEVVSPTFTLLHHYRGVCCDAIPVYHFDVYRLESDREFEDLGYEEQFFGDGVSIVEWANKVEKFLPPGSHRLRFEVLGEKRRRIVCTRKVKR